jgi:hypothetical protein
MNDGDLTPGALDRLRRALGRPDRHLTEEILLASNWLTDRDLEACRKEARESGKPLEQILSQRRLISPDQLSELARQKERRLQAARELDQALDAPEEALPTVDLFGPAGRYDRLQEVGSGGSAVVWKCRDRNLGRPVAIKILHLRGARTERRLVREARIVATLRHPHIVPVHEVGRCSEGAYLVMDWAVGRRIDASVCALWPGPHRGDVLQPQQ